MAKTSQGFTLNRTLIIEISFLLENEGFIFSNWFLYFV